MVDRAKSELVVALHILSHELRLEEGLGAAETLAANGDFAAVGELVVPLEVFLQFVALKLMDWVRLS